jgi:hypothetical protein
VSVHAKRDGSAYCDNGQEVSQNDDFANGSFNYDIVIFPAMSL